MSLRNKTQLGKILLKQKLVKPTELATILDEQADDQADDKERLASKVLEKGLADERNLLRALSEQHGVPAVNLDEIEINLKNLEIIPQDIAQKHLILPVFSEADNIHLAMADPQDTRVIDEIEFVSGKRVFPHVALHKQIVKTIRICYSALSTGQQLYRGDQYSEEHEDSASMGFDQASDSRGLESAIAQFSEIAEDEVDIEIDVDVPAGESESKGAARPGAPTPAAKQTKRKPARTKPLKAKPAGRKPAGAKPAGAKPAEAKPAEAKTAEAKTAEAKTARRAKTTVQLKKPAESPKAKPEPAAAQPAPSGLRLLVVDDEDEIKLLISRVLTEKGYAVVTASRGIEALQKVQTENPDMIILDAMLPEVHGFDICKKIKGSSRYGHIPVIMISAIYRGWRYAQDLKESYGVDAFIEKPFKISELIKTVDQFSRTTMAEAHPPQEELSNEAGRVLAEGIKAYREGRLDEAIDLLKKGIGIDPLAFKLHYHLALLLGKKGLNYQAIRELENALELVPDDFSALKNLAVLYQKAGFKFKAIETWERALGFCPDENVREDIKRHLMSLL